MGVYFSDLVLSEARVVELRLDGLLARARSPAARGAGLLVLGCGLASVLGLGTVVLGLRGLLSSHKRRCALSPVER